MSDKKIIFPNVNFYVSKSDNTIKDSSVHKIYIIESNFRKKHNGKYYLKYFTAKSKLPDESYLVSLIRTFYIDAYKNLLLMQVDEDWELDENQESETERLIKL